MRARYGVVEALLIFRTRDAVQAALDHTRDMLRLCRGDNLGVRGLMPALYLRLGQDQDCYDFIKWWATCDPDGHYDWGNTDLTYLDIHGADVFEPVERCMPDYALNHRIALTLLKVKLLLDLKTLQNAGAIGEKVPQEILDSIRGQLVSPVIASNADLLKTITTGKSLNTYLDTVNDQVETMYKAVDEDNKHFWPAVLSPGHHLTARPPYTSHGDVSEMQLALQYSYNAWVETPGAIDAIRRLMG